MSERKKKLKTLVEQPSIEEAESKAETEPETVVEQPTVSEASTSTIKAETEAETEAETKAETEAETEAGVKAETEAEEISLIKVSTETKSLVLVNPEAETEETSFIELPKDLKTTLGQAGLIMDTIDRLNKSFRARVCGCCFLYLSTLPIRMTIRGYPICGRCHESKEFKNVPSAISKANTFVRYFEFFCVNNLDGCDSGELKTDKIIEHEKNCIAPEIDCVFCSFKGRILQIIHHSVRHHRNNLCLDGVIEFSLKETTERKRTLVLVSGIGFLLKWQISENKVLLIIKMLIRSPDTRHYRIHFSRKGDAELPLEMLNEYGIISKKCDTCIEISKGQLKLKFGEKAILMCKISLEEVPMDTKIEEYKAREAKCNPQAIIDSINDFKVNTDPKEGEELCNSVSKFIKMFAHRLLKCVVCKQISSSGDRTNFCPELHGCCKKCWTGYCIICSEVKSYGDIPELGNLVVQCDWNDCNISTPFCQYLTHKATCPQRPYRCPLKNCNEIRLGVSALTNHWHCELPDIVVGNVYQFNKQSIKTEFVYWIHNGDIYVVTINLEETYVDVLLEEVDVVPNSNFETLSCSLQLGDQTYCIPMLGTYRKCEGKFVYSERITDYKPENKHLIVVINMNPDVPYQSSLVSVPVQRKPRHLVHSNSTD